MGDLGDTPDSGFRLLALDPALAIAVICRVNQEMEDLAFSISSAFQWKINLRKKKGNSRLGSVSLTDTGAQCTLCPEGSVR